MENMKVSEIELPAIPTWKECKAVYIDSEYLDQFIEEQCQTDASALVCISNRLDVTMAVTITRIVLISESPFCWT